MMIVKGGKVFQEHNLAFFVYGVLCFELTSQDVMLTFFRFNLNTRSLWKKIKNKI